MVGVGVEGGDSGGGSEPGVEEGVLRFGVGFGFILLLFGWRLWRDVAVVGNEDVFSQCWNLSEKSMLC